MTYGIITYQYRRLLYFLKWSKTTKCVRFKLAYCAIYIRIRFLNWNTKEKTIKILNRFLGFCEYKAKKENKDATRFLMESIAELSEEIGVPQWDIKSKIKRDFNIDI